MIYFLAWKNLWFKPLDTLLSILLLSFSVAVISVLVLAQTGFEEAYRSDVKKIDLVLGAKGSPLQLILSSVYHIDAPTGNIDYEQAKKWMNHSFVSEAIPLAYGDNFKGYSIVGTTDDYLGFFGRGLEKGTVFTSDFEVVIGHRIAQERKLKIGDRFYGAHGEHEEGHVHTKHAYVVKGIAKPTGKVMDDLILCSLNSVWEMHAPEHHESQKEEESHRQITAVLIHLKNKMGFVTWPRLVARKSNMQAASPAIEINRLFSLLGIGVRLAKYLAYGLMALAALSIFISLYTRLNLRRREFALIRVSGGGRRQLLKLVMGESIFLCLCGYIFGNILSRMAIVVLSWYARDEYRFDISPLHFIWEEVFLLAAVLGVGILAALMPAVKAYSLNLPKILSYE